MIRNRGQFLKVILAQAALVLLLSLGACGFKDKPVPPYQLIPQAVTDLQYQLNDKGVTLLWSYPTTTITGADITDTITFDLYQAVVPVDSYCKTCPIPFNEPVALPGGALSPDGKKTGTHQLTVLQPRHLYFFKVRSKRGWWIESKDSNVVSFQWNTPPMAPEGLTVVSGDTKNTLRWNSVNRHQDATPMTEPVQYQLYRSVDGASFAKVGEPVSATGYTDTGLENGRTYSYQVQALNTYAQGTVINSSMSASVDASPQDRTAPLPPSNVQGIRTDVGIKVFWDHVEASDLAGYRVYRRSEGEGPARFVGEIKLPYNMFIDTKAPQGATLLYSVTSVDNRDPANESALSPEVRVAN